MRRPRPKEQQWDACSDRVEAAAGMAEFAGNETLKAARGERVEQSLKQIFWRVVNEIMVTGPYWAIMWVIQRVSNSHVKKKKIKKK